MPRVGRGYKDPAREAAIAAGAKWYFTGEPCQNGHIAERMVSCHKCRECDRERNSRRYRENGAFRQRFLDKCKERREGEDRERILEAKKEHYENNKTHHNLRTAEWKKRNPDAFNAIRRRYYKNSPKPLAEKKARLKRVRHATPPWADMTAIREFYEKCPEGMVVDHIIPLRGKFVSGLHVVGNLQYLTPEENSAKSNHWPWKPEELGYDPTEPPVSDRLLARFHVNGDNSPKE